MGLEQAMPHRCGYLPSSLLSSFQLDVYEYTPTPSFLFYGFSIKILSFALILPTSQLRA